MQYKNRSQFDRRISVESNISFKSESSESDFGGIKLPKKLCVKLIIDAKPLLAAVEASNIHEFIGKTKRKVIDRYPDHSVKLFLEDEDMELTEETVEFKALNSSRTIRIQVNINKNASNQEIISSDLLGGMLNHNYIHYMPNNEFFIQSTFSCSMCVCVCLCLCLFVYLLIC